MGSGANSWINPNVCKFKIFLAFLELAWVKLHKIGTIDDLFIWKKNKIKIYSKSGLLFDKRQQFHKNRWWYLASDRSIDIQKFNILTKSSKKTRNV